MSCPDRIVIGGIEVYAFGKKEARQMGNRCPALAIITHGRNGSAHDVFHVGSRLLEAEDPGGMICLVIEQRNHGRRMVDESKNSNFNDNCTYAADMFGILHGTALDISFLIDMAPVVFNIFPRYIAVLGVSTGGYVALSAMANDPRVSIGLSLIGFADYELFLKQKAAKCGIKLDSTVYQKRVNEPLRLLLKEKDVVNRAKQLADRPVLFVQGEHDLATGACTDTFINRLQTLSARPDAVEVHVVKEVGHALTAPMLEHAVGFLQKWGKSVSQTC